MNGDDFGLLIPIIAVSGGIGLAFWSIYIKNKERMAMIEKGIAPTEMYRIRKNRTHPIIKAMVVIGVGLGLLISFGLRMYYPELHFRGLFTFGLALVLGGLGYLIGYFLLGKQNTPPERSE